MCVRAQRVISRRLRATLCHNHRLQLVLFSLFPLPSFFFLPLLLQAVVLTCDRLFKTPEAHAHTQAHTRARQQSHSFTAGIYRELKRRVHVGVFVCVCVCAWIQYEAVLHSTALVIIFTSQKMYKLVRRETNQSFQTARPHPKKKKEKESSGDFTPIFMQTEAMFFYQTPTNPDHSPVNVPVYYIIYHIPCLSLRCL